MKQQLRRFCVVGSPRSGSSFLISLLGNHPEVVMNKLGVGESFNFKVHLRNSSDIYKALQSPLKYAFSDNMAKIPSPLSLLR